MTLRVSIKNPADAISRRLRERNIPTLKKIDVFSNGSKNGHNRKGEIVRSQGCLYTHYFLKMDSLSLFSGMQNKHVLSDAQLFQGV